MNLIGMRASLPELAAPLAFVLPSLIQGLSRIPRKRGSPMIQQIIKRDGTVASYARERITDAIYKAAYQVGGHDRSQAEALAKKVEGVLAEGPEGSMPSVEEIQDIVEGVLIEEGHGKTAKSFILYRAQRAREREFKTRGKKGYASRGPDNIPYREVWRSLDWAVDNDVASVRGLNARIADGTFPDLVTEAEQRYHDDVMAIAEQVAERKGEVRLVIIAGPSSSGKTTSTIKMSERLREHGLELVALNLDNYFFDLEAHPKDEYGDYDFERPAALDLELINGHLEDLLAGRTIRTPRFDFVSGKRLAETDEMKIAPNQIILIDSLHGLFGPMTDSVPAEAKFKLYIETLCQMKDLDRKFVRWTDVRMLRRMVRDRRQRNYTPVRTVGHWHYVRRAELQYIVPYIKEADAILDGSLPYELPVMKKQIFACLDEIVEAFADDPKKQDAHLRAIRVRKLLDSITEWSDETVIPGTSLMREFIGGSSYTYHV